METTTPLHNQVVFCDFDGTITAVETFSGMLSHFSPALSAKLMPQMYSRHLSLREGVRRLVESIPSSSYCEILEYSAQQPIREGLAEFLSFLQKQNIPFIIVSGGLRGMIETVLEVHGLTNLVTEIYALEVETDGQYLKVYSAFEEGTELVAKSEVMKQYVAQETIAIGDSVTDINMSLSADFVFARDRLITYLESEEKSYLVWNDFFDILESFKQKCFFS